MLLRFQNLEIDTAAYRLTRAGEAVAVERLVFDLLTLLARHPGRVFSRDELLAEIWPGRLVSDTTISGTVKNARKAIGDDGKRQKFIQTVHGRGFRWVAEVAVSDTAAPIPELQSAADALPCLLILPALPLESQPGASSQATQLVSQLERIFARLPLLGISAEGGRYAGVARIPSPRKMHEEIGISHLLEIQFHQLTGPLEIEVQLSDARSGLRIWSEQFQAPESSRPALGALAIQIIRRFEPQLSESIYSQLVATRGQQSAHALYLQASGLLALKGWHADTFEEAASLLRDSLTKQPDLAEAAAYLALLLAFGHRIGLLSARQHHLTEAQAVAEQALQHSPRDSTVLGYVGCAYCDMNQLAQGIPLLKRSVDINPANAQAWAALGAACLVSRDPEQAVQHLSHGIDISPLDNRLSVWRSLLAIAHMLGGDPASAAQLAQEASLDDARNYMPRVVLAASRLLLQDRKGASQSLAAARQVKPDLSPAEVEGLVGKKLRLQLLGLDSR